MVYSDKMNTKIISKKSECHHAFPILFQDKINSEKLTVVYRSASKHLFDKNSQILRKVSLDGGNTWNSSTILYKDEGFDCRNYGGGVTSKNEYFLFFVKWNGGYPNESFDLWYIHGINGFDEVTINHINIKPAVLSPYGKLIDIPEKNILIQGYYIGSYELVDNKLCILVSNDNGKTWINKTIFHGMKNITLTETDFIYLDNGKIFGISRDDSSNCIMILKSEDYGNIWNIKRIPINIMVVPWLCYIPERNKVVLFTGHEYNNCIGFRAMDADMLFTEPKEIILSTPPKYLIKYPYKYNDCTYPSTSYIKKTDNFVVVHYGGTNNETYLYSSNIRYDEIVDIIKVV